jgi:hypothetical protein
MARAAAGCGRFGIADTWKRDGTMLRTFFAGLGVLFALIVVFFASFLGGLAWEMHSNGPSYETLAVDITRQLARDWSAQDIKAHYSVNVAYRLNTPAAQRAFDRLRPLGGLRYVDDVRRRTRWSTDSLRELTSAAEGAEILSELLSKTVRITFVAKFDNGFADVTMELRNESGEMKLWQLQIESQEPVVGPARRQQAISRA